VSALSDDDLVDLFGTSKPTREMIESTDDLFDVLERSRRRTSPRVALPA
jgi:hypothetical protein